MTHVYLMVEGQTEENFVNDLLAPHFGGLGVYLFPRLLGRPGHQGGRVNYARVKNDVSIFLKQQRGAYCTTLIDLYRLGEGFPGSAQTTTVIPGRARPDRARQIEQAMKADIIATLGDDWRADMRFIPYIQQHEFEGLLFSDPEALAQGISRPQLAKQFRDIREEFNTPEDINDSPQTAPSKRILQIHPAYQKPIDGVQAAKAIGLGTIRAECPRFHAWLTQIENLGQGNI